MTDLEFFLDQIKQAALAPNSTVSQIIGNPQRKWTGKFTIGDFNDAVARQTTISNMKRFYQGKVEWYKRGGNSPQDADRKAKDDIGSVFHDLTWWRRLQWWLAARIKKSDICHA